MEREISLCNWRVFANNDVQRGVPEDAIILETKSLTTEENARFAAEELSKKMAIDMQPDQTPTPRVIVSTCAYHVYRCEKLFSKYFKQLRVIGVDAVTQSNPSKVQRPSTMWIWWLRVRGSLREVGAVVKNTLLGHM